MKMKYILLPILLLISVSSFAQDTVIVKKQKGFLFLTDYNYQYDWDSSEIRPLGFHDFFYPVKNFDNSLLCDSNINVLFKNGVRVDFINNRKPLKEKAMSFTGKDTSNCYQFNKFYILQVEIEYKIFEDYEPYVCRRNSYELQIVNGSKLRFEYLHKAIKPLRITPKGVIGKVK